MESHRENWIILLLWQEWQAPPSNSPSTSACRVRVQLFSRMEVVVVVVVARWCSQLEMESSVRKQSCQMWHESSQHCLCHLSTQQRVALSFDYPGCCWDRRIQTGINCQHLLHPYNKMTAAIDAAATVAVEEAGEPNEYKDGWISNDMASLPSSFMQNAPTWLNSGDVYFCSIETSINGTEMSRFFMAKRLHAKEEKKRVCKPLCDCVH